MIKRIDTLDVTKGIGILLVVFAHVFTIQPSLTIIYSFHMPLFFMASGMLFKPEKYKSVKELFISRARTLLCPYVLFCVLGIMANTVFTIVSTRSVHELIMFLLKSLLSVVWAPYSLKYFSLFNIPLWFVPCLLLVQILYYFIYKFYKNKMSDVKGKILFWLTIAVVCVLGWISELPELPIDFSFLPWNFSSACFTLGFFALGNLLFPLLNKKIILPEKNGKQIALLIICVIVSLGITIPTGLLNGKISIGSRELENGLLLYISGIFGTVACVALGRLLSNCKFLQFCGKNSFRIMGIHILILNVLAYAEKTFLFDESYLDKAGVQLVNVFAVTLMSLVFVIVYNYILKNVLQRIKKNAENV